jgi:hypothetical protein
VNSSSFYEVRVKGHLEEDWGDWFDGMSITHTGNGETILSGPLPDQAALFGLLFKINSLNLTLLSINFVSVSLDS